MTDARDLPSPHALEALADRLVAIANWKLRIDGEHAGDAAGDFEAAAAEFAKANADAMASCLCAYAIQTRMGQLNIRDKCIRMTVSGAAGRLRLYASQLRRGTVTL